MKKKGLASLAWFLIAHVSCSFLLYVLGKVTDDSIPQTCWKKIFLYRKKYFVKYYQLFMVISLLKKKQILPKTIQNKVFPEWAGYNI